MGGIAEADPRDGVVPDLKHYERLAADRVTGTASLDAARLEVAREHGFRTWRRFVAAVDGARKAAVPVRPYPTDPRWDFKKEARDLAREAGQGSPEHLQRFRVALLHLAEASDAEIAAAAARQARYVLEVEYGGRLLNPRHSPAQKRTWIERVWDGHDRDSRRKRADMSPREQAFVEAAMGDSRLPDEPDLSRPQALLDEDPSLIESAGSIALGQALGWHRGEPIVRWLLERG
ncbi:MAG TPA: hypothetical protein EYO90_12585, partial [Candidatus Latescibacteria bacterium]|nr:hypothetical protein [Candidatus Latescibacterota bacterium]